MKMHRYVLWTALALMSAPVLVFGQFDLSWHTIDGGGGASSGGPYSISGTVGQADANSAAAPMSGGSFEIVGGFWTVALDICTCPGDMDANGLRNGRDIQQFVNCILASTDGCSCADVDGSGSLTSGDITVFVGNLLSSAPCP